MKQDNIFLQSEGNAWYDRNKHSLSEKVQSDWPLALIRRNKLKFNRVLEFGCSNGWRLSELSDKGVELHGIDASEKAINEGKVLFPNLKLKYGEISSIKESEKFDLMIVNFVLHWIDRENIFQILASLDALLLDKGYLIIGDFCPMRPSRRKYHHLPDKDVWTWKQDYGGVFESAGMYEKLDSERFRHSESGEEKNITSGNDAACVLLQKNLGGLYALEK